MATIFQQEKTVEESILQEDYYKTLVAALADGGAPDMGHPRIEAMLKTHIALLATDSEYERIFTEYAAIGQSPSSIKIREKFQAAAEQKNDVLSTLHAAWIAVRHLPTLMQMKRFEDRLWGKAAKRLNPE